MRTVAIQHNNTNTIIMKKRRLFSGLLATFLIVVAMPLEAQDKLEGSVKADFVSTYLWRGTNPATASVQPTLGLVYKGLSLSAWGNVAFKGKEYESGVETGRNVDEFDITLSYSTHGLTVGVTDYYFDYDDHPYFKYSSHETSHIWEAFLGYDFGFMNATWYTNVGGADGVNKSGNRAYSSYVELNAPFHLASLDWMASLGFVPYATSFYPDAGGFAVNNMALKATKNIIITSNFSLPIFAQIMVNPSTQKAWFMAGFTLEP